jgi:predicted transcriptional regulator
MGIYYRTHTRPGRAPGTALTERQQLVLADIRQHPGSTGSAIAARQNIHRANMTKIAGALMRRGLITNEQRGRFVHFFPDNPDNPKGDTIGNRRGRAKQERYEKWLQGEELRKIERERLRKTYAMLLERRPPAVMEIARELGIPSADHLVRKLVSLGLAERVGRRRAHRAFRAVIPDRLRAWEADRLPLHHTRRSIA